MIMIYSTDSDGKLFTDAKQHFYIDAELLQEKAYIIRRQHLLNQIAECLGYQDFDSLETTTRCHGVTKETMDAWIASGDLVKNLKLAL